MCISDGIVWDLAVSSFEETLYFVLLLVFNSALALDIKLEY